MDDDIVSRIRQQANAGYIDEHEVMLREAADEIERLQTEVNSWMGVAERFAESDPRFDAHLNYFKLRFKGNDRG